MFMSTSPVQGKLVYYQQVLPSSAPVTTSLLTLYIIPCCLSRAFLTPFCYPIPSPPMGTSLIHGDVIRYLGMSVNRCKIVRQFVRPARIVQAGRPECPPMALTCPWRLDGGMRGWMPGWRHLSNFPEFFYLVTRSPLDNPWWTGILPSRIARTTHPI